MSYLVDKRDRQRLASRMYRLRNPERVRANGRKWYAANSEKRKASQKAWYQKTRNCPGYKEKANALARKSYLPRSKKQILEATGGLPRPLVCDVCGGKTRISLDHCPKKLVFRGWLCMSCNLVLEHVKDDPDRLRKLAKYLEER